MKCVCLNVYECALLERWMYNCLCLSTDNQLHAYYTLQVQELRKGNYQAGLYCIKQLSGNGDYLSHLDL